MSEMWCWPHEFVQPEMLTRTPPTSASPAFSSAVPMSSASPRDCVTARLQVSAPGHATTSRARSAPGAAIPIAPRRACRSASWSSRSPRSAKFCRFVTRTSKPLAHLLHAHRVDLRVHAPPQRVAAIAVVLEHTHDRLERRHEVLARRELRGRLHRVRVGAEPAGDEDLEAGLECAVRLGPVHAD